MGRAWRRQIGSPCVQVSSGVEAFVRALCLLRDLNCLCVAGWRPSAMCQLCMWVMQVDGLLGAHALATLAVAASDAAGVYIRDLVGDAAPADEPMLATQPPTAATCPHNGDAEARATKALQLLAVALRAPGTPIDIRNFVHESTTMALMGWVRKLMLAARTIKRSREAYASAPDQSAPQPPARRTRSKTLPACCAGGLCARTVDVLWRAASKALDVSRCGL